MGMNTQGGANKKAAAGTAEAAGDTHLWAAACPHSAHGAGREHAPYGGGGEAEAGDATHHGARSALTVNDFPDVPENGRLAHAKYRREHFLSLKTF